MHLCVVQVLLCFRDFIRSSKQKVMGMIVSEGILQTLEAKKKA